MPQSVTLNVKLTETSSHAISKGQCIMSQCQVYLYEEQKQFLLEYIRERCSNIIITLWTAAIIFSFMLLLIGYDILMEGSFTLTELTANCLVYMLMSGLVFVKTFVCNFGKTFGYGCDKKCIENDWYTLDYGNFVYRDKNTANKHPYHISDKSYNQYICPRFLDWRNATEDTMFLYIKLDNGRNYAITKDPYMK